MSSNNLMTMMTMAETYVYPASPEDVPLISALAHSIWPEAYASILTEQQIDNMLDCIYSEENLLEEMHRGHQFWIALHDEIPAAYASGYRENADIVWLKKLYVEPGFQGRGIGSRLIAAVIQHFSPATELRLLANSNNTAAQNYYMNCGFHKIGELPVRMGNWDFVDHLYAKPLGQRRH